MAKPKFKQGIAFVPDRGSKPLGSRNIEDYSQLQAEQAKCNACGCNDCKCYETICSASTGELLVRYYIGPVGGPYEEVIEPLEQGLENINTYYNNR